MTQYIIAAAIIVALASVFTSEVLDSLRHTKSEVIEARQRTYEELNKQLQPLGDQLVYDSSAETAAEVSLDGADETTAIETLQSVTSGQYKDELSGLTAEVTN